MGYRMNIGNELAQIKNCKTLEEIKKFLEDHNLKFDHWYFNRNTSSSFEDTLYVVAYYQTENGVFISMTFNFNI